MAEFEVKVVSSTLHHSAAMPQARLELLCPCIAPAKRLLDDLRRSRTSGVDGQSLQPCKPYLLNLEGEILDGGHSALVIGFYRERAEYCFESTVSEERTH